MSPNTTLFLLATALAAASLHAAVPDGPLLAVPGKVIYENALVAKPEEPWKAAKGKWTPSEGALRGAELPEDNHGAVLRMTGPVADNVIIEYQFRFLDDAKTTSLSVNGTKDHVCRLLMTPKTFTVQKDDNDHEGPDKAVVFSRQAADLAPEVWHTVRLEIIGDQMLGQCDDMVGFGANELITKPKMNMGFTVGGQSVEFRALKISEATLNPKWETVKASLPAGKPAPAPAAPKGKGKGAAKKKAAAAN
ncbi:MAG: hypothetical protein U0984_05005 [Prosthecobacter sp.]|nr:hypothetical protein [Prosthecobacter sp.]